MSFRVFIADPHAATGELFSTSMASADDALGLAADLIAAGDTVLRIEDGTGAVVRNREEVEAWYAGRRP